MNLPSTSVLMAGVFAICTALFWGTYGPLLQKGHHHMESGRLRPFICVGIAYLLVAIVGPIVAMYTTGMEMETSKGSGLFHGWTARGIVWSIVAGSVGALGAFTLIMAINYGGVASTIYVMPIVFGCAPVVSTFTSMYMHKTLGQISPFFAAGLILVAAGAITILVTAPRPGKSPAKNSHSAKPPAALVGGERKASS
ncbi:MAG: hypothetical protein WD872_07420 [Pirellulaceae bacterium]